MKILQMRKLAKAFSIKNSFLNLEKIKLGLLQKIKIGHTFLSFCAFLVILLKIIYYIVYTHPSETNQVLELSPVYKILTINATFEGEFFSFCKQTAAPEPSICHAVV